MPFKGSLTGFMFSEGSGLMQSPTLPRTTLIPVAVTQAAPSELKASTALEFERMPQGRSTFAAPEILTALSAVRLRAQTQVSLMTAVVLEGFALATHRLQV